MKIEDLQKSKLVEIGWRFGQSYGGGHLAAQHVMSVVANRVRAGWGQWLEVLNDIPKYMAESQMPPLEFPNVWEGNFVKILHVVDGVHDGSAKDLSNGALYWADTSRIENPWFLEKIVRATKENGQRQHPTVANMNSLTFFR